MADNVFKFIFSFNPTWGSPGAKPATELVMVLSAATGFAYAVKPLVYAQHGHKLMGLAYFALSEYYSPVPELDEWIRRRLRMCYWKQWRRCRKRVGELLKRGVSERQAVLTALSRKSYPASPGGSAVASWHLLASPKRLREGGSRTMATHWGLNDAWLKSQGLVSVRDLWITFHYPAANQSG